MLRSGRSRIVATAVALVALLLAGLWFFSDAHQAERAHHNAVERWEENEPAAYTFTISSCSDMCGPCERTMTVRDGVAVAVLARPRGCAGVDPRALTMEDVFEIEDQLRSDHWSHRLSISFDVLRGYPEYVDLTCRQAASDCGTGMGVSDFEVLL